MLLIYCMHMDPNPFAKSLLHDLHWVLKNNRMFLKGGRKLVGKAWEIPQRQQPEFRKYDKASLPTIYQQFVFMSKCYFYPSPIL